MGQIDYFTHISADRFGRRPDWHRDDKPSDDQGYATQLIAREAVRLVREQPKDKPLFLYVAFNAIHGPWMVPESYCEPYQSLPPNRRTVAGMLAAVDEAIGQVLSALKTANMDTNTLIIFSSDNGGPRPGDRTMNTPLRDGKGSIYEGGVRSSAFAVLPGKIPAGRRVSQPVHLIDWYPTLLRLAGADPGQSLPVDGLDLWPLLTQGKPLDRDALLLAGTPQRAAIRMGDWKLLLNPVGRDQVRAKAPEGDIAPPPSSDVIELYNLADDISESHDLSAAQPERVRTMHARLNAMMKSAAPSLAATPSKAATPTK